MSLFITCLVDQFYPEVGTSVVQLLRRHGCEVDFPATQTCCGQPAFNSGYVKPAREAALNHLAAFEDAEYIVSPSGSCTGMIRHYYHELFSDEPAMASRVDAMAARTYEFSQFLVNILGVDDVGARFPFRVTYHPSCHASRILGAVDEPMRLLSKVHDMELVPLTNAQDCCGFGGTFSGQDIQRVRSHGRRKVGQYRQDARCGLPHLVGTDMGCLMNIAGSMSRRGVPIKAIHLAQLLAGEVAAKPSMAPTGTRR